ncbi:hypothetical protein BJV77DRAFT_668997 [Russula vinacea]|nr:hypothetical protein BJV77DRAFT_668997 [Russula vinacea]
MGPDLPDMFNSSREIREQALSHRELVKGKRRISLLSMEKLKNINFKKKLKEFVVSSVIGGLATEAGTDIYNDASKHHGNSTNPASTNGNGTFTYGNSSIPLTTGNETDPTNLVTPNGIPIYNNPTGSNPTNLVTTNGISMYNNPTSPPTTNDISSTNIVSNNSIARAMASRSDQVELETPHMALPTRHMVGPRIPSEVRSQDIAFDAPPSRPHF